MLAAAIAIIAWSSVPPLTGRLVVADLGSPVRIVRDANAVPHVFARTIADLYRGLGFVHAQDRLWQMEMMRRASQGRLSEIFGERTLDPDLFLRTLDLHGHAERALARFSPEARALLEAYAEGVNAFLTRPTGLLEQRLPPEFLLLRHRPEPWHPADSVAVVKMMALNLSANLNAEIRRLTLAAQGMSPAEIEDVMPLNRGERPPPLPDLRQLYPLRPLTASRPHARTATLDSFLDPGASNSWVLAGTRTRSGRPLLANDPHLRLSAPSIWYLAHLALETPPGGTVNAVGASLPGTPLIVLGRGDTLAWGFTNAEADVQDLYIEKVNPADPSQYLAPEGWRRFETDTIDIRVRGAGTRTFTRRRTRHGPVLPEGFRDLRRILAPGYVAALQWTALGDEDTTISAGFLDPKVRTVPAYLERMRSYMVPMQTMVVADRDGRIALTAPGRLPVRHPANSVAGRAPVPGWEAIYDWTGLVPRDELPREEDPPAGAIGTANARFVPPGYSHLITYDWEADYRLRRIAELVLGRSDHDLGTMRAAQLDVLSPAAAELLPMMIAATRTAAGADARVLDQLSHWGARMRVDAAEPLIFIAWLRASVRAILADDLGAAFDAFFQPRAKMMTRLLRGEATGRDWCDDRLTTEHESCGAILARALSTALDELEARFGRDRSAWSWGKAHYADGAHQVFERLPVLGWLSHVGLPSPGGFYTLDRGVAEFGAADPFANRHAPSYRAIYDLEDLDQSLYVQTTGQSGNPFSRYYRTFERMWSAGAYVRIPTKRPEIERNVIGIWQLDPARSGEP